MSQEWLEYKKNIGTAGPDEGNILFEIELPDLARIFIEEKVDKMNVVIYAVTVVVYGTLITTSYYKRMEDAMEHTSAAQILIQALCH